MKLYEVILVDTIKHPGQGGWAQVGTRVYRTESTNSPCELEYDVQNQLVKIILNGKTVCIPTARVEQMIVADDAAAHKAPPPKKQQMLNPRAVQAAKNAALGLKDADDPNTPV
jgi:hypothetical protein